MLVANFVVFMEQGRPNGHHEAKHLLLIFLLFFEVWWHLTASFQNRYGKAAYVKNKILINARNFNLCKIELDATDHGIGE